MAEINKPSDINKIWADGGDKVSPSDVKIDLGWEVEVPPRQFFNWLDNKQDLFNAHVNQHGLPVWDSVTEYQAGKSYVQGSNGLIYVALQTHTNQNPVADISNVYWFPYQRHGMITFTSAGVTNWTVPLAMKLGIIKPRVTVIGAGGGGGAAISSAGYNAAGGGAGAGGLAQEVLDLSSEVTITITVGAAGTGGVAGGAGAGAGGTSSFGAFCSATGGSGGVAATASAGSSQVGAGNAGGFGSGGAINGVGGGGQPGVIASGLAGATAGSGLGGTSYYSGRDILGAGGVGGATAGGLQNINGAAGAAGCVVIEW